MRRICFIVLILSELCFSVPVFAADWYVDSAASGSNTGTSWADAWTGLGRIVWGPSGLKAGDTLFISGGITNKTYGETLSIGASGAAGSPITVRVGQEYPHNGTVIIDKNGTNYFGISISGQSYITISGQVGSDSNQHMKVTRAPFSGINIGGASHDFDIGYIEFYGNGDRDAVSAVQVTVTENPSLGEIHHCKVHDNYALQIWLTRAGGSFNTNYGSLKIHSNEIYNFEADAIDGSLSGVDFYNNTIHDRMTALTDYTDIIQWWGRYFRFYNNRLYRLARDYNTVEPTTWQPNTKYRYGSFVYKTWPNTEKKFWGQRASGECTSGTTEPDWSVCTINNGSGCTDGTCLWKSKMGAPNTDGTFWPTDWAVNAHIKYSPDKNVDANPTNVMIFNNLIYETDMPRCTSCSYARGVEMSTADPTLSTVRNIQIFQNTIDSVPAYGITIGFNMLGADNVSNISIENNLLKNAAQASSGNAVNVNTGNGSCTIGSHGSAATITVDNNLVYADAAHSNTWGFGSGTSYISGDTNGYLSGMLMYGISLANTDKMRLYWNFNGAAKRIDIYKDSTKTLLVASGSRSGAGTITLSPIGGSGISGSINVVATTPLDDTDAGNIIYLANGGLRHTFDDFKRYVANANGISSDPMLDADRKLEPSSPAIDAGANLAEVAEYDADGTARPQGAGWDIGAYEYVAAEGEHIYIAQNPSGSDSGLDCTNAHSAAWFNAAANWGSGTGKLGAGDTVHLCGVFTGTAGGTMLQAKGDGSAGDPIMILFEPGAKLTSPYWGGAGGNTDGGAINLFQRRYIIVDGNGGIIENTDDGTNRTYQQQSRAIEASESGYVTIKNLHIQDIYVHASDLDLTDNMGEYTNAIVWTGAVNLTIDNVTAHDIGCVFRGDGNNFTLKNSELFNFNHGVHAGISDTSRHGIFMHDNHLHGMANWDTTNNMHHHDGIMVYSLGNGVYSNINIYNNLWDGDYGHNANSWIYMAYGWSNSRIFNNVMVVNGDAIASSPFIIGNTIGHESSNNEVYNNVIISNYTYTGNLIGVDIGYQTNLTFKNNIILGSRYDIVVTSSTFAPGGINYNVYQDIGTDSKGTAVNFNYNGPYTNSLTTWQGWLPPGSGQDMNSRLGTAAQIRISISGRSQTGSIAIASGTNLASLCTGALAPLCYDIDGHPRPSSGPWDIGAYEYTGNMTYHRADINQNGCIELSELLAFIIRWKISNADVSLGELISTIAEWKEGCG